MAIKLTVTLIQLFYLFFRALISAMTSSSSSILFKTLPRFCPPQFDHFNGAIKFQGATGIACDFNGYVGWIGRVFSCGNIALRGICSNKFPQRRYMKNPIWAAWVFGNTAGQTAAFVLDVPAKFAISFPLRGVLEISPQGTISAYFEQDTPIN